MENETLSSLVLDEHALYRIMTELGSVVVLQETSCFNRFTFTQTYKKNTCAVQQRTKSSKSKAIQSTVM